MSTYDIPDGNDDEWLREMLRELEENIKIIIEEFGEDHPSISDAMGITSALRQYSGY